MADTLEEAEAAVAAERARRELAHEVTTWKEQAASCFAARVGLSDDVAQQHAAAAWDAALDMCNGNPAEAVLLDPSEQVDEELSHWTD